MAEETGSAAERPRRLSGPMRAAFAVGSLVVILACVLYYLHARQFEDTDDAQIDGHIHPISARVSGTILRVNPEVQENKPVAAGTVLAEIDSADFDAELARAKADVSRLEATAAAAKTEIPIVSANTTGQLRTAEAAVSESRQAVSTERANAAAVAARVAQAEANYKRAEDDRKRYSNLLEKQEISRSEYDRRATEASTASATLDAAKADAVAAHEKVRQAESRVSQREAELTAARSAPQQVAVTRERSGSAAADAQRAQALLQSAQLNLQYTKIVAPVAGLVGRKTVETGQRVQAGQELLTIIELDDVWVTANFKETQLQHMRPGQPATIHIDSYNRDYDGYVESIAPATGARFSLLPPENATGNFVKVVQRVPV
ncbi:MAG TPA: HlyD family secretion protein [Thermoanaerobaculia bacterium]